MRNLLLCNGPSRVPEGYATLDANPMHEPTFVATIPPLPDAVKAQSWERIELHHGIEHFYYWDAITLLQEIREVLEPAGLLVLEQPNIEFAARVLLHLTPPLAGTCPNQCDMWPLYGDPTHQDPLYTHRWGWTPRTLMDACRDAGFKRISVHKATTHWAERDFRLEARP